MRDRRNSRMIGVMETATPMLADITIDQALESSQSTPNMAFRPSAVNGRLKPLDGATLRVGPVVACSSGDWRGGYARALLVPESLRVIPRLESKRMPASQGLGKPASNSGRSGGVHVLLVSGGCIDIDDLRPLNIVFDRILSNVLKFFHDLKNSLDVLLEQKEPLPARLV